MSKTKLYVNKELKPETRKEHQVGIVNLIMGKIEIAFFSVVATNQDFSRCTKKANKWITDNYSFAQRGMLPRSETIQLANKGERNPYFTSCCTSTQLVDYYNRVRVFDAIDEKGHASKTISGGNVENVYAALQMSVEEFKAINPDIDLNAYLFKNKDYYDPFTL